MVVLLDEKQVNGDEPNASASRLSVADPWAMERAGRERTWSEQEWEGGLVHAVLASQPRRSRWVRVIRRLAGRRF